MTNFLDILFLIQLLAVLAIFFYKLYNLMHKAEKYDLKIAFLLFIGFLIAWGFGLINIMFNTSSVIYIQLFKFETWLLPLNIVFIFAELFFNVSKALPKEIKSHKSILDYKKGV